MKLSDEQSLNIRLNLALNALKKAETTEELERLYQWVIGPQSSIIPVAQLKVQQ